MQSVGSVVVVKMQTSQYSLKIGSVPPRCAHVRAMVAGRSKSAPRRRGMALLLCLFVLSLVSVWVVDMFQSAAIYQSALRNTIEYEQALYLANAGVHHAVAELESNPAWRNTVTAGTYPATGSYSATAANGSAAGTVEITATGVAGGATRRLRATILVN